MLFTCCLHQGSRGTKWYNVRINVLLMINVTKGMRLRIIRDIALFIFFLLFQNLLWNETKQTYLKFWIIHNNHSRSLWAYEEKWKPCGWSRKLTIVRTWVVITLLPQPALFIRIEKGVHQVVAIVFWYFEWFGFYTLV